MAEMRQVNGKWELWENGLVFSRHNTEADALAALENRKKSGELLAYRQRQDYLRKTYQSN